MLGSRQPQLLLLSCFVVSVLCQQYPPPWPQQFSIGHNSSVAAVGYYTTGTIYYDWTQKVQRMTNSNCPFLGFAFCDFLFVNDNIYLIVEDIFCCMMYEGLTPTPPNWVDFLTYNGTATIEGIPSYQYVVTTDLGAHYWWVAEDTLNPVAFLGSMPWPGHPLGWSFFSHGGFVVGEQDPALFKLPFDCLSSCSLGSGKLVLKE